ncbi:hypothetical protein D3C81_1391240 [compost metagenome]
MLVVFLLDFDRYPPPSFELSLDTLVECSQAVDQRLACTAADTQGRTGLGLAGFCRALFYPDTGRFFLECGDDTRQGGSYFHQVGFLPLDAFFSIADDRASGLGFDDLVR